MNKWLDFSGDPDHRLDTGIVCRIRYHWEIGKAWLSWNYEIITSPAHDNTTAAALHAACSVTGANYRETGKMGLGGGLHCPSFYTVGHKKEPTYFFGNFIKNQWILM